MRACTSLLAARILSEHGLYLSPYASLIMAGSEIRLWIIEKDEKVKAIMMVRMCWTLPFLSGSLRWRTVVDINA